MGGPSKLAQGAKGLKTMSLAKLSLAGKQAKKGMASMAHAAISGGTPRKGTTPRQRTGAPAPTQLFGGTQLHEPAHQAVAC